MDLSLIRSSFETMKPVADQVAERFFENLWKDYPESKPLFRSTDMGNQKFSFFNAIGFIVENLERSEDLEPFLRGLGAAHVAYGVQDHHYGWIGVTLSKTFSQILGATWTENLSREWSNVFSLISSLMLEGARDNKKGVDDNPIEKIRHMQRLAEPIPGHAPLTPSSRTAPASSGSAPIELPENIRREIRAQVRNQIQSAIRLEFDKATREELEQLRSQDWSNYLKKAA